MEAKVKVMTKVQLSPKFIKLTILLFLFPALFINLGFFPLISDEPTRGIVSLEMLISGNFINPTINGETYLNKPPLFNWLQILLINLTGSMDEFVFRLPSVIALLLMAGLIYFTTRKYLGDYAFVAATGYIVCGRILFWDSFMGLIDLTYSLVTFGSFVWLIHFHKKRKYLLFFTGSYLLAAIGFLMKGMPSLAFQAISILSLLIYDKAYKQLFTIKHLTGIAIFLILVGGYLVLYNKNQPVNDLLFQFLRESNRTGITSQNSSSWWLHLVQFPANYIFEFLPLTILLILLFSSSIRKLTFSERQLRYLILLFLSNIVIYWFSADMRSRYLFMLVPLLSIVLLKAYITAENLNHRLYRITQTTLLTGNFFISLSLLIYPFWFETRNFNGVIPITVILFLVSGSIWIMSLKNKRLVLFSVICSLLLARVAFNLFNFQARINSYPDKFYKDGEITAAQISKGHPLYVLSDTPINHDASFYITRERKEILKRTLIATYPGAYYISNEENLGIFARNSKNYRVHHIFRIKKDQTRLYLVKAY